MAAIAHRIIFALRFLWSWIILGALLPVIAFPRLTAPIAIADAFPSGAIRVGVDASHAPFASYVNGELTGLDVDLAHLIGAELNTPITLSPLGFDGLYDAVYADQVDVLIAALPRDPTRENRVLYTPPYFEAGILLVVPRSSSIERMADLADRRVAYEFGSTAHSEIDLWARRILPFQRMPYQFATDALDSVRMGQSDAAIVDSVTVRIYLRQHPDWSAHMPQVVLSIPYVIVLRQDRATQAVLITEVLESLHDSGALENLIAKWL